LETIRKEANEMTIEERLKRLERENRRLKIMFLSIFLFLGIVFILGAKGEKEIKADVIKARVIDVVDVNGKPRIIMWVGHGMPQIEFLDEREMREASWNGSDLVLYQEPELYSYYGKGVKGVWLSSGRERGGPSLTLLNKDGNEITLDSFFPAGLRVKQGDAYVKMGFLSKGKPHLELWEETGEGIALGSQMEWLWKKGHLKKGPFLSLFDREREERVALSIEGGNGELVLYDRFGNTKVRF
jgi:hypothetical protein